MKQKNKLLFCPLAIMTAILMLSSSCNNTGNRVIDIDGNAYNTVAIGTQVWLIENLKTTKFNDGTAIPMVKDPLVWVHLLTPGYCWYNNDAAAYKNSYGALYNWYTVNTGKLAPTGWHVPTDAEWTILTDFLGGEDKAGGKMKETGTAPPGGFRYYFGNFHSEGYYGYWWSATEKDTTNAKARYTCYLSAGARSCTYNKTGGYSVRCIRD